VLSNVLLFTEEVGMGTLERREREKQATRQKILDTARALFLSRGYDQVSMRQIADAIEYTPAAIYVHFKDKLDLMSQMCREDFARFHQQVKQLASDPDPVERIRRAGHAYIQFAVTHPNHFRFMFMTTHPGEIVPTEEELREAQDPDTNGYAFLRAAVVDAIEQKRFAPEHNDPELITQTLWAAVHGVATIQVTMEHDPWLRLAPLEARANTIVEAVLRGLQSSPSSTPPGREGTTRKQSRAAGGAL
jgi:AcrR family transcriptional regulator